MKIGILGSGRGGEKRSRTGFLKHGHDVVVGTRNVSKLADWLQENPAARAGSFTEAAKFGEIAVLAVKGSVAAEALRVAGAVKSRGQTGDRRHQSDRGTRRR